MFTIQAPICVDFIIHMMFGRRHKQIVFILWLFLDKYIGNVWWHCNKKITVVDPFIIKAETKTKHFFGNCFSFCESIYLRRVTWDLSQTGTMVMGMVWDRRLSSYTTDFLFLPTKNLFSIMILLTFWDRVLDLKNRNKSFCTLILFIE